MDSFHYPPIDATALRAGCCLTSIGALTYGPGQAYPKAGHPRDFDFRWERGRKLSDFALVMIVSGRGEWEATKGDLQPLEAGDALFLVPGGWHRYKPASEHGWGEKWICVQGSAVHGFVSAGLLPGRCLIMEGVLRRDRVARLDHLRRDVAAKPGASLPSWGVRALAVMLECFETQRPIAPPEESFASTTATALGFIRENAHRPIGVRDVAVHCGLVRRTLERHFQRAASMSVGRAIILERIAGAEMLLTETSMQVKEVAYACGFGGPQRMIYDFRRLRGITPGRVRRPESG
ncbi:MAG: helix-turn-helix domain-containing protein [Chthoniobacterales bacterium]